MTLEPPSFLGCFHSKETKSFPILPVLRSTGGPGGTKTQKNMMK